MKLVFVIHDREKFLSGPIINLRRIIPILIKRGYKVYLLNFYTDGTPNNNYFDSKGVIIHSYSNNKSLQEKVFWVLKTMQSINPDVFFSDVSIASCIAGKWLKEGGISVINYHRSDDQFNWKKAEVFSEKGSDFELSGIICVNNFLNRKLAEKIDINIPSWVIPSGVPLSNHIATHSNKKFRIVYAGRLFEKQKRIRSTINQLIKICQKDLDIEVTIIGDGPEKKYCEDLVKSGGVGSQFDFTGNLYEEEYHKKLSEHNAIILLSDYEGTPGSIMDGMSCGLVPIVLKYDGIGDLIDHEKSGFIVEDRSKSFLNAINILKNNSEMLETLGGNARKTIEDNYSVEVTVDKIEGAIKDVYVNDMKKTFILPKKIYLPDQYKTKRKMTWKKQLKSLIGR